MLKLPKHAIEECRLKSSNILKLKQILVEWLSGAHKGCKESTLESLKTALESETVAQSNLAISLEDSYRTHFKSQSKSDTSAETNIDRIIRYQSSSTKVADHKSALLEVQVRETSESVSYQWMKNGQPLSDNSHFSGTSTAMLFINQASLGTEGAYSCQVKCGQLLETTETANLHVLYSPEKKCLISLYSQKDKVPQSLWPLGTCNSYIDLTLVKNNKVKKPSDFVVKEEMEALLVFQEKIDYDSAFGEYMSGSIVLVEGRPGSGKTTLANKLVYDWSRGKALKNADKVFLISLRKDLTRSDMFEIFFRSNLQQCIRVVDESQGKSTCFVLDGYNELNPNAKNYFKIVNIIDNQYLPESMVIITSRPEASIGLRANANMGIEILGFTRKQFELYIKEYPFYNSSDIKKSTGLQKSSTLTKSCCPIKSRDPSKEKEFRIRLQNYVSSCTNVLNMLLAY